MKTEVSNIAKLRADWAGLGDWLWCSRDALLFFGLLEGDAVSEEKWTEIKDFDFDLLTSDAGALIFLEKIGRHHQMMRICERARLKK